MVNKTPKTQSEQGFEFPNYPSSIAEISAYFLKSESWVTSSKNALKEIWFWDSSVMFLESGSLSEVGFDRLVEFYEMTSSTVKVIKRGKPASQKRKPKMTVEQYKSMVWAREGKRSLDEELNPYSHPSDNRVYGVANEEAIDIELIELEVSPVDQSADINDRSSALVTQSGGLMLSNYETLMNLAELQGSQIGAALKEARLSAIAAELATETEEVAKMLKTPEAKQGKVSRRKKSV